MATKNEKYPYSLKTAHFFFSEFKPFFDMQGWIECTDYILTREDSPFYYTIRFKNENHQLIATLGLTNSEL